MKTFRMRVEDVQRRWFHIDVEGKILGKLAVKTANLLMGKEKPDLHPGCGHG